MKIHLIATAITAALAGTVTLSQDVTPAASVTPEEAQIEPTGNPGVAPAADIPRVPVSPADQGFFLRQAHLQREIRLLELQVRLKELRDEITGNPDTPVAPTITPGGPIIGVPVAASAPVPSVIDAGAPRPPPPRTPFTLLSVYGSEGVYRADLAVGMARVTIRPGDNLPGGWTVVSIEQFQVTLRKGGRTETLRLGG
ncbi:MAG: hypothetical protein DDT25_00083 [Chloroflexi bacterium]|nr:hypothetical protein [Chloroflexota bacterium]